jgi:hypothetical protein
VAEDGASCDLAASSVMVIPASPHRFDSIDH